MPTYLYLFLKYPTVFLPFVHHKNQMTHRKCPTPNNPPKPSGFGPSGARPPPRSRSRSQQSTATRTFPHPRNVCPRALVVGSVGREGVFPVFTRGELVELLRIKKNGHLNRKKKKNTPTRWFNAKCPFHPPNVGGHVFTPWVRVTGHLTIPKRSRLESPGTWKLIGIRSIKYLWQLVLAGFRGFKLMEFNGKGCCCRKVDYTKGEAENVTSIWVIKRARIKDFSKLVWCFLIIFFFGVHQNPWWCLQPPFSSVPKLPRVLCRL